jgi:hypothetical protein
LKSDGTTIRTLQGFASITPGEKWHDIYTAYNGGVATYADVFTTSACKGTGDFASRSSGPTITTISQGQGCMKGSQYQNVWMYVIHELEAAIVDCEASTTGTHWDEAVAFYTGSATLSDPTTNIGVFGYGVGEKKCPLFGTCTASSANSALYKSAVNEKVLSLFASGRDMQSGFQCTDMEAVKESLVKQFAVPLVQGTMQYLYLADTAPSEKYSAELWSFASALLPLVDHYSATAATNLKSNSLITNATPVPGGYVAAKASLESVYSAMGITCADIGGWKDSSTTSGYATGMEPCSDKIVGYQTNNDVSRHLQLDKDQVSLNAAVSANDLTLAYTRYSEGKKSHI